MDAIEEVTYRGMVIEVHQDEDAESPRAWDNLGTMACFHRRYTLGDEHDCRDLDDLLLAVTSEVDPDIESKLDYWENEGWERLAGTLEEKLRQCAARKNAIVWTVFEKGFLWLPLYLYDHSGLSVSTDTFIGRAHHAEWDSGCVGIIYVSKDRVRKEYGVKRVSPKVREKALVVLRSEVETYDEYLRGEVYGYEVKRPDPATLDREGWDVLDSCWGFYGLECCLEEARSVADHYAELAA